MTTQAYITGDNAPGYLPEGEPRGPWNTWRDACADLARMIDDASEEHADNAEDMHAAQAIVDATFAAQALVTAAQHRPLGDELKHGFDLLFMGRAYFIYPAEADEEPAPEGWRVAGGPTDADPAAIERDQLLAIARAAMAVDIGGPSQSRLDAFAALGAALVAYNGAPMHFGGRLNPDGPAYPPNDKRFRETGA